MFAYITTIRKRKRPLSDLMRGLEKPLPKYRERHARICVCLCFSIVDIEVLKFLMTIAFAVFCQSGLAFAAPKEQR